jgi:myosin-5
MELLAILTNVETQLGNAQAEHTHETQRVVGEVKGDLRMLASQLYTSWVRSLRTRVDKMVIPAVIETQELMSYMCKINAGGFFSRFIVPTKPEFDMNDLIAYLNKIWAVVNFYYVDLDIGKQIILEVLDHVGMSAFNHLVVSKNFCSWKRGMQIEYNVSRLQDWCQHHQFDNVSFNIEALSQAAQLLQLPKNNSNDVQVMFDVCNLLNATQMKKILLVYVSDFENPITEGILREISDKTDTTTHTLYLTAKPRMDPHLFQAARPVMTVENYLPAWLDLPKLQLFIKLVA